MINIIKEIRKIISGNIHGSRVGFIDWCDGEVVTFNIYEQEIPISVYVKTKEVVLNADLINDKLTGDMLIELGKIVNLIQENIECVLELYYDNSNNIKSKNDEKITNNKIKYNLRTFYYKNGINEEYLKKEIDESVLKKDIIRLEKIINKLKNKDKSIYKGKIEQLWKDFGVVELGYNLGDVNPNNKYETYVTYEGHKHKVLNVILESNNLPTLQVAPYDHNPFVGLEEMENKNVIDKYMKIIEEAIITLKMKEV